MLAVAFIKAWQGTNCNCNIQQYCQEQEQCNMNIAATVSKPNQQWTRAATLPSELTSRERNRTETVSSNIIIKIIMKIYYFCCCCLGLCCEFFQNRVAADRCNKKFEWFSFSSYFHFYSVTIWVFLHFLAVAVAICVFFHLWLKTTTTMLTKQTTTKRQTAKSNISHGATL